MIEVVRLLLAGVFAVAAVAKLADLGGAARAAQSFGAPRRVARPVALLVALAELGIAATLVPAVSARPAAAAAAALVAAFTVAISISLLRGRAPDCHCFGQLHSAPAGPATLARNAALAALAVLVASRPAAGPTLLELAAVVMVILVSAQALLSLTLLRRYGWALRRIEELEVADATSSGPELGEPAPPFALPTTAGGHVTLERLLEAGRPLLLVFVDSGCGACSALFPSLASADDDIFTLAVLGHGDHDLLRAAADEHGLDEILVVPDFSLFREYGSEAAPSAVLVDADGRIASPMLYGAEDIAEILGGDRSVAVEVAA
jgi:methylamine dehydrogenase accessory protein MauD